MFILKQGTGSELSPIQRFNFSKVLFSKSDHIMFYQLSNNLEYLLLASKNILPISKKRKQGNKSKNKRGRRKSEKSEAAAAQETVHTYQGTEDFDQPLRSSLQPIQCWCIAQLYVQFLGDERLLLRPPQVLDYSP